MPYWYAGKTCRVCREGEWLHIYDEALPREFAAHPVTWGRKGSLCENQYADAQPVELPTALVATIVERVEPLEGKPGFEKFDFEGRLRR